MASDSQAGKDTFSLPVVGRTKWPTEWIQVILVFTGGGTQNGPRQSSSVYHDPSGFRERTSEWFEGRTEDREERADCYDARMRRS